ncbi:hypothetical protein B0H14DRAFT_3482468 [Mycena olivaceomarginata]|nr:hypothetical protein B0H14DRAFT_3482468 [Mycena olivaceomarginata]
MAWGCRGTPRAPTVSSVVTRRARITPPPLPGGRALWYHLSDPASCASLTSTPTLTAPGSDKVTAVGQQRVVDAVSVFSTGGGTTFDKARSSALEDITSTSARSRHWETSPTRAPDDDMGGGVKQPESGKWLPADSLAILDGDECPWLRFRGFRLTVRFISRFGNTYENWTNDVLGLEVRVRPAYYLYWLDSDSTSSTLRWDTCSGGPSVCSLASLGDAPALSAARRLNVVLLPIHPFTRWSSFPAVDCFLSTGWRTPRRRPRPPYGTPPRTFPGPLSRRDTRLPSQHRAAICVLTDPPSSLSPPSIPPPVHGQTTTLSNAVLPALSSPVTTPPIGLLPPLHYDPRRATTLRSRYPDPLATYLPVSSAPRSLGSLYQA